MADENTTNQVAHQYNLRFETADGNKTIKIDGPARDYQWNEKQWQLIFRVNKADHRGEEIEQIGSATGAIALYEDNTPISHYYGYENAIDNLRYHDDYDSAVHNITIIQKDMVEERLTAAEDAILFLMMK